MNALSKADDTIRTTALVTVGVDGLTIAARESVDRAARALRHERHITDAHALFDEAEMLRTQADCEEALGIVRKQLGITHYQEAREALEKAECALHVLQEALHSEDWSDPFDAAPESGEVER